MCQPQKGLRPGYSIPIFIIGLRRRICDLQDSPRRMEEISKWPLAEKKVPAPAVGQRSPDHALFGLRPCSDSLIYCASSIIGTLILIFPIPSIYLNKDDLDPWGPLWIYEFIIYLSFTYDYFCFLFFLLVVYCPQRI
ncbi:uncharacterized protein LOC143807307 isoform X1 [Ranitomeya variabilis]|uniref:uncharacterized protein LOC143807307 isoform X1 n=1 Tax=Ranitomeya variabilis TaxID=490064 RepID=UPI00405718C0